MLRFVSIKMKMITCILRDVLWKKWSGLRISHSRHESVVEHVRDCDVKFSEGQIKREGGSDISLLRCRPI